MLAEITNEIYSGISMSGRLQWQGCSDKAAVTRSICFEEHNALYFSSSSCLQACVPGECGGKAIVCCLCSE